MIALPRAVAALLTLLLTASRPLTSSARAHTPVSAFASRPGVAESTPSVFPGGTRAGKKKKTYPQPRRKGAQQAQDPVPGGQKGPPSAADLAAQSCGLRVVPVRHRPKVERKRNIGNGEISPKVERKRNIGNGKVTAPPSPQQQPHSEVRIEWGRSARRFFWGDDGGRAPSVRPLPNDSRFPLFLIRSALPAPALQRALASLAGADAASEADRVEQHELVAGGKVRAIRRSRVARLDPGGCAAHADLMRDVAAGLPPELGRDSGRSHPYEDGSVVYYRTGGKDYYDVHHDSYDAAEPPRARQRAYTVLLYLRSPALGDGGGTEFVRLQPVAGDGGRSGRGGEGGNVGVVVVPQPGDALIWPNFDRDGRPCANSVHRALPLASKKGAGANGIGKIVVNMWFEGRRIKPNERVRRTKRK